MDTIRSKVVQKCRIKRVIQKRSVSAVFLAYVLGCGEKGFARDRVPAINGNLKELIVRSEQREPTRKLQAQTQRHHPRISFTMSEHTKYRRRFTASAPRGSNW